MSIGSREEIVRQTSFIAYYFHWPEPDILRLTLPARRRYCEEINRINKEINGEANNIFSV